MRDVGITFVYVSAFLQAKRRRQRRRKHELHLGDGQAHEFRLGIFYMPSAHVHCPRTFFFLPPIHTLDDAPRRRCFPKGYLSARLARPCVRALERRNTCLNAHHSIRSTSPQLRCSTFEETNEKDDFA